MILPTKKEMELKESILYSNCFGSVTDKRVILNYKNGQEDIPINQITSVSYQHRRNIFFVASSFLIVIFGLLCILNHEHTLWIPLTGLVFLVTGLLIGIAHWIGHRLSNLR